MSERHLKAASLTFVVTYDLRDPEAWQRAHKHRRLWGKLYSDYHILDQDHVLLAFRSAGERWERWEQARKRMILGESTWGAT